jgi:hypothetical protein
MRLLILATMDWAGMSLLGGQLADTDLESVAESGLYCGSRFNILLPGGAGIPVQGVVLEVGLERRRGGW